MNKTHINRLLRPVLLGTAFALCLSSAATAQRNKPSLPKCTAEALTSKNMFSCMAAAGFPGLRDGRAVTYQNPAARSAFPANWDQYGFDQRHDPVFPGNEYTQGTFWAAPITGLDMLRALEAQPTFGDPESWASRTGQWLGEVMGVSVANGIVYSQIGKRLVTALDATTGRRIWQQEIVNSAGMGQSVVHHVNGRPMVFVPVGDAAFNVYNNIDFAHGLEHDRGGSFGALYAFDGLTGVLQWRFDVEGAARPTPIYHNDRIHLATSGGELFVIDPATGAQIGKETNPGNGFPGLASPNWYKTADGGLFAIYYGISRPRLFLAVDVTNPANPEVEWTLDFPNDTANSPGDTSPAIDPDLAMIFTTVFSSIGGENHVIAYGIDALTGDIVWEVDMGAGDSPPGFKASVPMVKNGIVYTGNTSNGTFWSIVAETGEVRWSIDLDDTTTDSGPQRPRAAASYYTDPETGESVLIHAAGPHIRTIDPDTGAILNDFTTAGVFGVFGVAQPAIVGRQVYLAAISGWVFAFPIDFIMTNEGFPGFPNFEDTLFDAPPFVAKFDARARPTGQAIGQTPNRWLQYALNQSNNAYVPKGKLAVNWETPLQDAIPLDAPPFQEAVYGTEVATQMTHFEFGVGSGLAVANGMVYAGSNRFHINALNAQTGKLVWSFETLNRNFGQPLVTSRTVIVGGGDPFTNLGNSGSFAEQDPATVLGASLQHVSGLDPRNGRERWTVWTSGGTSGHTPLYYKGNVYWVNGEGKIYAVNADTGAPVAPFMDAEGNPLIRLGGFNAISSPNLYTANGRALMIVGMAMPDRLVAIDLATAATAWEQDLAAFDVFITGFAATSVAVDQETGTVIGSVLVNAVPDEEEDPEQGVPSGQSELLAFGLNAADGSARWTQPLGVGEYAEGFVAGVPVLSRGAAYLSNPARNEVVSLNLADGAVRWQSVVVFPDGKFSWGPGTVVTGGDQQRLIMPAGPGLNVFDAATGILTNSVHIGGSFTYNNPAVVGRTVYIGNSWGWVTALPLLEVLGEDIGGGEFPGHGKKGEFPGKGKKSEFPGKGKKGGFPGRG